MSKLRGKVVFMSDASCEAWDTIHGSDDGDHWQRTPPSLVCGGPLAVDFSALDRLSGLALEKAMASMSPDERDAYMRAG